MGPQPNANKKQNDCGGSDSGVSTKNTKNVVTFTKDQASK